MDINIKDMLPNIFGQRTKKRKMKVNEAFEYLIQEEEQRLIDMDQVTRMAIDRVENSGIVFLDEIDKIAGARRRPWAGRFAGRVAARHPADRRGTTVNTRYGMVRTDHILFIGGRCVSCFKAQRSDSGVAGTVPIRVELQSLTMDDFVRILRSRNRRWSSSTRPCWRLKE